MQSDIVRKLGFNGDNQPPRRGEILGLLSFFEGPVMSAIGKQFRRIPPTKQAEAVDSLVFLTGTPFAIHQQLGRPKMLGQRCHAMRSIRGHQGLITANAQGTIEAEISNLGRHLIAVRWDTGLQMYVFPEEIEIHQRMEETPD